MYEIDALYEKERLESIENVYQENRSKKILLLVALCVSILIFSIYAAAVGSANLTISDTFLAVANKLLPDYFGPPDYKSAKVIVIDIRLPRVLLAIVTGVSLGMAGAVMQGVLRNPLVSPFTLGLSSASSFGAVIAIAMTGSIIALADQHYYIILSSFIFGCLSIILVYLLSRFKSADQATLILGGVVIGYIFQAGVLVLKYFSNNEKLRDMVVWIMGGMWGATWNAVIILIPIVVICMAYLWYRSWDLNAFMAGEDVATSLGVSTDRMKITCLIAATLAASSCIAFTGVIGFIGLMAPHICKILIGPDNRYIIPCSALMGGLILLVSDTLARTVMVPVEIPVGVIMYIVGGIFFLYLILRKKGEHLA